MDKSRILREPPVILPVSNHIFSDVFDGAIGIFEVISSFFSLTVIFLPLLPSIIFGMLTFPRLPKILIGFLEDFLLDVAASI